MKKIYTITSIAVCVLAETVIASNVVRDEKQLLDLIEISQLEAERNLDRKFMPAQAAQPACSAKAGALQQKNKMTLLHQGMPKNIGSGKTAEEIANKLSQRSEIFGQIEILAGKVGKVPLVDYEAKLRENLIAIKSMQARYITEVQDAASEANLQSLIRSFQAMIETLEQEYYDLLLAVKQ